MNKQRKNISLVNSINSSNKYNLQLSYCKVVWAMDQVHVPEEDILVDKALIFIAGEDISEQHGKEKKEEEELSKPTKSPKRNICNGYSVAGYTPPSPHPPIIIFVPQNLELKKRSGLQVKS